MKEDKSEISDSQSNETPAEIKKALFIYQSQPAITCSKLTIETPEQGVRYVQSLTIKIPELYC